MSIDVGYVSINYEFKFIFYFGNIYKLFLFVVLLFCCYWCYRYSFYILNYLYWLLWYKAYSYCDCLKVWYYFPYTIICGNYYFCVYYPIYRCLLFIYLNIIVCWIWWGFISLRLSYSGAHTYFWYYFILFIEITILISWGRISFCGIVFVSNIFGKFWLYVIIYIMKIPHVWVISLIEDELVLSLVLDQ